MGKPKVLLPFISFCGKNFGHSKWFSHLLRCEVCNRKWEEFKRNKTKELLDKWEVKCACGCGLLAAYDKKYAVGHFDKTEKFRNIRSKHMKKNNPMYIEESKKKISEFWTGRKRPNQSGKNNVAKQKKIRNKISKNNPMKKKEHRKKQRAGCSTEKERRRRSDFMKKNNPSYNKEIVNKRVNTYTKKLSEGKYQIKTKWKTGWFLKKDGTKEWYDSSYEKKRMEYYEQNNIQWTKRHKIRINYTNDKDMDTYYVPDFLILCDGKKIIEEIKGWIDDSVRKKAEVAIAYCKKNNLKYRLLLGKDCNIVSELSME